MESQHSSISVADTNSAYRRYMQGQLDPQAARQAYRDQMKVSQQLAMDAEPVFCAVLC
jgi:hypothetical protein